VWTKNKQKAIDEELIRTPKTVDFFVVTTSIGHYAVIGGYYDGNAIWPTASVPSMIDATAVFRCQLLPVRHAF
jgi:hypothetical protein